MNRQLPVARSDYLDDFISFSVLLVPRIFEQQQPSNALLAASSLGFDPKSPNTLEKKKTKKQRSSNSESVMSQSTTPQVEKKSTRTWSGNDFVSPNPMPNSANHPLNTPLSSFHKCVSFSSSPSLSLSLPSKWQRNFRFRVCHHHHPYLPNDVFFFDRKNHIVGPFVDRFAWRTGGWLKQKVIAMARD